MVDIKSLNISHQNINLSITEFHKNKDNKKAPNAYFNGFRFEVKN